MSRSSPVKKRATLADVAARCGVTAMTASRALRAGTKVAAETRAAVEAAARELGYQADPFLSALVNYRSNVRAPRRTATIAWVTNHAAGAEWRSWPVFRGFFEGARARAAELGYGLEEFWLRQAGTPRRAMGIARNRGYAGLLLAPGGSAAWHSRLDLAELPAVALGQTLRRPRLHQAAGDFFRAAGDLLHELKRLGYRRPGFVADYAHDARVEHRASAGVASWQSLFLEEERRVPACLVAREELGVALPAWYRRWRPDVVVGLDAWPAQVLERAGVVIPGEAGFACVALNAGDEPRFSGMRMDHLGVGAAATDLLHAQIMRGERGVPETPRAVLVEARWQAGETAPARR